MARKGKKTTKMNRKTAAQVTEVSTDNKKAGKTGKVFAVVMAVIVIFTAVEIYFNTVNSIRQSKKPVYAGSWPVQYKGYTSAGEYGDFLYVNDTSSGDVYKTDKATGTLEKVLTFPEGTSSVVADSKGDIYVLTKTDEVLQIDGKTYKTVKKIKPEGLQHLVWMDIDSNDNFFLVDGSSTIGKYGPDFKKILQFGGQGDGKGNLNAVGKIFVGLKDNIYALNTYKPNAFEVKVFDNSGKFLSSWPITKIKSFDSQTNLAFANDGNIYINSYKENRIYVFSPAGKFLGSFDSDKDGKFQMVNGAVLICGGKNGLLYVFSSQIGILKTISY